MPECDMSWRRLIWMRMLVSASAAAGVVDGSGVPAGQPQFRRQFDDLLPGGALVARDQHVAFDLDVLLEQVRSDVLKRGDDHHVIA